MAKKDSMQEEVEKTENEEAKKDQQAEKGEQLDLIDVAPENAKPMIEVGRLYNKAKTARLKALAKEVEYKDKIRQLAKEAHLQRLENGVIRFTYQGVTICITPQDEKVTVKEKADED